VLRGNVVDVAVGIIIGAAFGKIVASMVDGLLLPPIGQLLGNLDFSDLFIDLSGAGHETLAAAKAAGAASPPPPSAELQLLQEIRDALRARA